MAEANPKVESSSLWEMAKFPEGVPKTPWNFHIYVMYAVIKHIVRGSFKKQIDSVLQNGSCQTSLHLGRVNYFELEKCFLLNQEYDEPLRVGSVAEDVIIVQIFRQACEETQDDANMDVLSADLSFECDYNLCFKHITASEVQASFQEGSCQNSINVIVLPSSVPGQARLTPSDTDYSSVPGLSSLCVQDDDGLIVISSEVLVSELYYLLTLNTAVMNVLKCQEKQTSANGSKDDANESAYGTSLQYVGQGGPAVHIVTCVVPDTNNKKHLFLTEDVSISVPCNTWPNCASKWPIRERPSEWPSRELIETIIGDGCHLVPKYDPMGQGGASKDANGKHAPPMTSWRYSFSLAEKTLMNSITDDQRMCYIIFKYLFAQFVKLQSVITTYTAKTLFLWELETVPRDQWCFSKIGDRVKSLVEKLRNCIKDKYCQHFFIDGCNTLNQMDDKSRQVTLDNGFRMLDEEMSKGPNFETGTLEVTSDFPFHFMTTYKSFYPINVWLEAVSAQMKSKLYPPSKPPNEQNIVDFVDRAKVHPIQMPEILIHLVMADKVYGRPLSVPQSLLQQQKVVQVVEFLKRSTSDANFEECIKDLDIELKFLHFQYKVIDEIEQFLTDNPVFAYSFDSSDESDREDSKS